MTPEEKRRAAAVLKRYANLLDGYSSTVTARNRRLRKEAAEARDLAAKLEAEAND